MSDAIADLFMTLSMVDAPALASMAEFSAAGEEMVVTLTTSLATLQGELAGLGAEFTGLAASVTEAGAAAGATDAEIATMSAGFGEVGAAAGAMGAEVDTVLAAMQAQIAATDAELATLPAEMAAATAETTSLSAGLATETTAAAASTDALGASMTTAGNSAAAANTTLGMSNNALVAVGAAAVGAAYEAVKMGGDFQQSITKLSTSAGEAQSNLTMIGNGITAMAGQVGYSAQDLANAMYMVESSGQHGAAALTTLQAAAQGAKTENADLTTTVNAVTDAMKDYGPAAGSAADVTSKLVAATSTGKTSFQDLSGAMSAILPQAAAAGESLNDILGMLSSMTVHGESAQQSAQNLADALQHMVQPTQAQSKELAALGINATQLSQSIGQQGLSGAVNEVATAIQNQMGPGTSAVVLNLTNALNGLPPAVQATGEAVLNGTESWTQWNASTKDLPEIQKAQAASFATLANSMHTIGTQSLSGAQVMQTYNGAMQKAMGDASGLNVALMTTGQNLSTTTSDISTISGATADASGNVAGWAQVQGNFNQKIDEAKSAFGALVTSIGEKLLPVLTVLFGWLASGITLLAQHQSLAAGLAIIIGGTLVLAITALTVKMAAWFAQTAAGLINSSIKWGAWLLTKLGILSTAGEATVAEGVTEVAATEATEVQKLAATVAGMGRWLATKLGILSSAEAATVTEGTAEVAAGETSNAARLANAISSGAVWLAAKVSQGVAAAASAVTQAAIATAAWVAGNATMLADQLASGAVWLASWVATGVAAAASSVAEAAIAAAAWVAANAAIILATGGIILIIGALIAIVYELITNWGAVENAAKAVWGAVTGAVQSMYNVVSGLIGSLIGMFSNAGSWLVNAGYNIVVGLWNGIASGWSWLENSVSSLASSLLSTAKSALGISSPSKKFADEVGAQLAPGIVLGIAATTGVATTAAQQLAAHVTQAAQQGLTGSGGLGSIGTTGFGATTGGLVPSATSGGMNLQVVVQGHVWTTQDLMQEIQTQLLQHGIRNNTSGITYSYS